jgi:hypothetical protein
MVLFIAISFLVLDVLLCLIRRRQSLWHAMMHNNILNSQERIFKVFVSHCICAQGGSTDRHMVP